jgi:hypothetical protein
MKRNEEDLDMNLPPIRERQSLQDDIPKPNAIVLSRAAGPIHRTSMRERVAELLFIPYLPTSFDRAPPDSNESAGTRPPRLKT